MLHSEAEVAAILAHEIGHIERSHCLDAVRFQLLAKKIRSRSLGQLADYAVRILLGHSFSKTQEDEADIYAYDMILNTSYDPYAVSNSFKRLLDYSNAGTGKKKKAHVIRDYFKTHPPLELRVEKFSVRARSWWESFPQQKRYIGVSNLRTRTSFYRDSTNDLEWRPAEW